MNTANEAKINSESTEIHRLFYVEDDNFSNGDEYKMAIDYQNMPKIVENLRQLDVQKAKIFGIFGDDMDVTKFLYSLFPDGQNKIESLFSNCDRMPTIWTIFNNIDLVFLLICNQDLALEKGNYFTVVMQRFLQDICHNIIICPSETFFTNFSTEHSFHGKPHGSRTYKLVKKELVDIQTPKNIKLDDKNIFKLVLDESCQNALSTNNSPTTYCVRKIVQETNQTTANNRFNELKELLQKYFDIGTANLRTIFKLCDETRIFLSIKQKAKIEKVITDHVQLYNNQTAHIDHEVKSFINELIGKGKILSSLRHDTEKEIRKKLYEITKSWLIEPKHSKTTAEDCTEYLIGSLENHFKNKPSKFNITDEHRSEFISRMKKNDKKNEVRDLQELCIKFIILEAQSENQFDVHFDIHPLHYIPEFDTEHHLQHISVNSSAPIKITFNELNTFMNLSVLSESDRLALPRRIKLIACYRTSDGKSEIIIINRPNIVNERLSENDGYSILLHKNGFFKKIPDYSRFGIHLAYASSQNSQTLVFYHKTTGEVSRWSVNESGELKSHTILHQLDKSNQPSGVKSLALTAAQDLLILIDSTSTVYSIDISNETNAVTLLLYKTTNSSINQRDFMTNDGELYDNVQTIGEKNPIFFFQAKNCIDIIDQNYCQMFSIKLIHNAQFYKMQIFTDFFDTYCVLFNSQVNEVYCIQNLISDTRIERQESSNNLAESSQQYIGNRLLDIIKKGEIQFGVSDLMIETQYCLVLSPEYTSYCDKIKKYFKNLGVFGTLTIGYENMDLKCSTIDIECLIKTMLSRVPLQLCTIEMGTLVPLNNGRRDRMDHLSSKSFRIDMKAREISFSCLDYLLNNINENENIQIIGILGRQSTGKSYLLDIIFQTRFAVAAGRCTDGIWMSYVFLNNTHFVILDCEGLFSDQRTDNEEIKLISLLTAVCDITILSQDLGFSRFQDRLFALLSQAVEKISKSEKLFKGILLVAIRDISDNINKESFEAAENKFLDLQSRGKSGFLEQLFSNTFQIQLLHHYENRNFDHEVRGLRQLFFNYINTESQISRRWENGKTLADRLKILLVQLYTDDFIDSDEIHCEMKLVELIERMKKAWTTFDLNDEENIEINEQIIETTFNDKQYSIKLNHKKLYLEENASNQNFDNMCEFILNQLYPQNDSTTETDEEMNKIQVFVDKLIPEIMSYRSQQVKKWMIENFKQEFPIENNNIKDMKTKFLSTIEQYMRSFKLQICLKKCSICYLKCIKNSQHTQETKSLLEQKKEELKHILTSFEITDLKNIREHMEELNQKICTASANENNLRQRMNLLSIELKDLIEKEKIETQNDEYDSKIAIENEKIHGYHQKINDIYQQLKTLLPNNDLQDMNKLRQELDAELLLIIDPNQYNSDQLQTLVDLFHKNYKNGDKPKTDLLHWSIDGETIGITELIGHCQHQTPLFLAMMNKNIDQIFHYSIFIENNLKHIGKQLDEYKENLNNVETKINELKQKQINVQQETENTMKLIKENEIEEEEVAKEINDIKIQQETLSKTIYDDHQTNDTMNQLIHKKIQHYIENLKDKRNKIVHSHIYNDHETLETNKEKAVKTLQFLLDEKDQKERIITDYRKEMEETPDDHNRIHQCREEINSNEKTVKTIVEKLNRVQTKINSIETDQLLLEKMDEELYQIDQLKQSLHSSDERIQSKQKRLSQCLERVNKQKIEIKTLEEDDPDDFIEQEKQKLEKLNKQYDGLSTELNELEQQNLALYNNNTLLCKILNEQEFDLDKQNQILQDRHDELSKSLENLNEKNACILNNLSSNKAKLNEQNQQLSNISKELDDQNIAYGNCKEIVQFNGELNVSGNTLFESLNNVKNLLNTNLKRLNEIFQANTLIDDNAALSNAFKSADEELARLKTVRDQLSKQLDEITGNNRSFNFVNSQKCNEEYQSVIRKHKAASSLNENLKQQKLDSSIYSRLSKEISCLEKEAQNHCDCGTDHKCSGMCQICAAETITKQNLCMFKAGHNGEHKCDSGHICTKFCDICQFYDMPTSRCQFVYGHKEPERHQCEGTHQCPITCICSDPCATPLDLTQHKIHRCNKKDCWKPCMFPCGNLCATEDHNHDMTTESVTISIGCETRQMKKHLCDQSHYCQGICDAPGVCQQEYKTQQRKWKTESGEEFEYEHIEVQEVRGKCGVVIPAGKSSHDDITSHQCDGHKQHTCQERCPDCGSFCRNLHGHKGFHRTLHRNKDSHVFTSTNPTDTIEIRSSESQETDARKYKVGESAKPENCSVSCKRRGRSHFHLVECPGGVGCLGKVLGNRAKHSDAAYYYGPDQPSPKQFDEILCSTYWSQHKWLPPVDNEADLKLINLCNAYCKDHVIREKNVLTAQDGAKGFCTSDAWHIGNHVFQCQADHSTLEMYQGIDVCFVIDTTGSMDKYFEKVKQAIIRIVNDNQTFLAKIKSKCDFQFAIVDYRDHEPEGDYIYHKCDFTNHTAAMDYVMNLKSGSGGDLPEAVLDGLDAACALNWRKNADHLLFHILDAPPHGKIYTKRPDKWSNGCPCGKTAQNTLQAMKNKKIAYHILPCSNEINMMIGEFKKHIEVKTLAFNDKITFEGAIAKQVLEHLIDTEITLKKT
ncbi:unnamed protein product [Rotaria magnacalcarata]|uniref:VLIG-type G domain-containing protein n=2 Tax=Rotaria magnacalcarata TaxID=392030 RepID=A0A816ST00_9BILA|nr:unnamed protein product [Rotaria magnacalcarata]